MTFVVSYLTGVAVVPVCVVIARWTSRRLNIRMVLPAALSWAVSAGGVIVSALLSGNPAAADGAATVAVVALIIWWWRRRRRDRDPARAWSARALQRLRSMLRALRDSLQPAPRPAWEGAR